MLVIEAKGDPNQIGPEAFKLLFKTYFKLEGASRNLKGVAPRARWPVTLESPKSQWVGRYGLPVPENVNRLPATEAPSGFRVSLQTWKYGEIAEILHVGPYSEEKPTVERLQAFIREQGFEIAGEHEEEYVKGPGIIFKGRPDSYLTIIRYSLQEVKAQSPAL